jgi:hypothetical protein
VDGGARAWARCGLSALRWLVCKLRRRYEMGGRDGNASTEAQSIGVNRGASPITNRGASPITLRWILRGA